MKKLTTKQCIRICTLYYKDRARIYERGKNSIDSIAQKFGVAADTCRRVLHGKYKVNGTLFNPRKHGFCKTKYKPSVRKVKNARKSDKDNS